MQRKPVTWESLSVSSQGLQAKRMGTIFQWHPPPLQGKTSGPVVPSPLGFFLFPLQKSFSSNGSSENWHYFSIKMQILWLSSADRCNFKGDFFCWVLAVTRGFGELVFTVSAVREKERRAALSIPSSLWASVSFCTLELWQQGKLQVVIPPSLWRQAELSFKPPKQMLVGHGCKALRIGFLQPRLLTHIGA